MLLVITSPSKFPLSLSRLQSQRILPDSSLVSFLILFQKGAYSPHPMGIIYYNHIIISLGDYNRLTGLSTPWEFKCLQKASFQLILTPKRQTPEIRAMISTERKALEIVLTLRHTHLAQQGLSCGYKILPPDHMAWLLQTSNYNLRKGSSELCRTIDSFSVIWTSLSFASSGISDVNFFLQLNNAHPIKQSKAHQVHRPWRATLLYKGMLGGITCGQNL